MSGRAHRRLAGCGRRWLERPASNALHDEAHRQENLPPFDDALGSTASLPSPIADADTFQNEVRQQPIPTPSDDEWTTEMAALSPDAPVEGLGFEVRRQRSLTPLEGEPDPMGPLTLSGEAFNPLHGTRRRGPSLPSDPDKPIEGLGYEVRRQRSLTPVEGEPNPMVAPPPLAETAALLQHTRYQPRRRPPAAPPTFTISSRPVDPPCPEVGRDAPPARAPTRATAPQDRASMPAWWLAAGNGTDEDEISLDLSDGIEEYGDPYR